jgi:hypothetical protein
MPTPRKYLLNLADPGWVHCVSRCVRRAYLAGDAWEHRRVWIEERLRLLAATWACEVAAYAVMSNHIHVVVRVLPAVAATWSAEEVVRRWMAVYPGRGQRMSDGTVIEPPPEVVAIRAADAAFVATARARLGDLPEFMKALKEPIARMANREDDCSGAFWERRYTSVPLLDQAALIACMAYVDLNPIRARLSDRPETSAYTGVRERVRARQRHRVGARAAGLPAADRARVLTRARLEAVPRGMEDGLWLAPLARCVVALSAAEGGAAAEARYAMTPEDYLTLVDASGRLLRPGKRGAIPAELLPILRRLDISVDDWLATLTGWRSMVGSALGHAASRAVEALRRGTAWVRNRCPLFAAKAG